MANRKPPNNYNVEQALLGAMIISPTALSDCLGVLNESDFFDNKNKIVFNAMLSLYNKKNPVDTTTITTELTNSKQLELIGGADYLLELSDSAVPFTNLEHYISILKDTTSMRDLLETMRNIINEYNSNKISDMSQFVGQAEEAITSVTRRRRISDFKPVSEVTEMLEKEIDILKESTKAGNASLTGVTTGYSQLNNILHGFQRGDLIILAARTGVGKTAFALNLAYNAATKGNVPVAIFSLEMPATTLVKRIVAAEANVSHDSLTTGFIKPRDRIAVSEACRIISKTKIFIHDAQGIQVLDILAKCRQLKAKEPDLGLIIVDHIGLVEADKNIKSRQEVVQTISIYLKRIAMELKVPVIAIAQLNRKADENPGHSPELSNLRESGSIEQDADVVLLMWRDDYYANAKKSKKDNFNESVEKTLESKETKGDPSISLTNINIAKNRNGRTGRVQLVFRRDYMKFDTPSQEFTEQFNSINDNMLNGEDFD